MALHAYGQRMRAIWEKDQASFEKCFAAFKEGAREDVQPVQEPTIEAPEIGPAKTPSLEDQMKERTKGIEPPEIGPARDTPKRDEPDMDR